MKRAVIFDMDGTLLDTERHYMDGWRQAGVLEGNPVSEEALRRTRGLNSREVSIKIFRECCGEDFPYDAVLARTWQLAEEYIGACTPDALRKPRVLETLETLGEKGYLLAVATSTTQSRAHAHMTQAGLLDHFQAVITGDMVKNSKPAPDIFLLAAERLHCGPEECIVVGDSPNDVFAAVAAGMDAYLIPDQVPANPETRALSRRVLEDMGQLISAMEALG